MNQVVNLSDFAVPTDLKASIDFMWTSIEANVRGFNDCRERAIKDAMSYYGCGVRHLVLEEHPGGRFVVRLRTREEDWLNWLTDNHGWGRQ